MDGIIPPARFTCGIPQEGGNGVSLGSGPSSPSLGLMDGGCVALMSSVTPGSTENSRTVCLDLVQHPQNKTT